MKIGETCWCNYNGEILRTTIIEIHKDFAILETIGGVRCVVAIKHCHRLKSVEDLRQLQEILESKLLN